MAPQELIFQRASVHLLHDAQRLEDGKDLNDALLDFFVKLGQHLIPEDSAPAVAYLGSHFYDVLRKGGVRDGRAGHKNVANWAKRRLGKGGLFSEGIGAVAIPVNEVLGAGGYEPGRNNGHEPEKHWWLALLLNPGAYGSRPGSCEDEDISLLCLDSFVRAETQFRPPIQAFKQGGTLKTYPVEVTSMSRVGFCVDVTFSASGDGESGALSLAQKTCLRAGGREFPNIRVDLTSKFLGGDGVAGRLEGTLGFRLDRRGAAKTGGEYHLAYGELGDDYQPQLRIKMGTKPTACQAQVAQFLGGYLLKERETTVGGGAEAGGLAPTKTDSLAICLPGIPQQETSYDCGFFILESILRILQLTPKALRELATASSVEIAMLPWPSQKQVLRRKSMLRQAMDLMVSSAAQAGHGNVEVLLKSDEKLRGNLRSLLQDGGSSFLNGFERWAVGDWDLSPSPSRSRSRSRSRSKNAKEGRRNKKKRKRRGRSEDGETRKRSRSERSARSRSNSGSRASRSDTEKKEARPQVPTFTQQDLESTKTKELRELCVKLGVLPEGIVERGDLVSALRPLAVAPEAPEPVKAPSAVPIQVPIDFTRGDLDGMPSKVLRLLCIQHKVLPVGMVEKGELIDALAPLSSG